MSSKISNKFTFIDLYAGIGGMRIPFEELEVNAFLALRMINLQERLTLKCSMRKMSQ